MPSTNTTAAARTRALLARRTATLGPHSPLFYSEPIQLVSGEGVWLTDVEGKRYLDGYNNVPHVGHANPRVAEAVDKQMRTLNIHTRYLHENVVDYAESLLSTFATGLDRLFLVNSGSEANELALRLARQHTRSTGVLVSDFSYHGNTTALAELTTGLDTREPLGSHVRPIRIPDATGLSESDAAALCTQALAEVDTAIGSLLKAGHGVSAVLIDPLFSTEGLVAPPRGYVEGLVHRVWEAGGLYVADEVQAGFGRTGHHMWGNEAYRVKPDLVTLGKPMGNGHPMGGVVTTEELLDEFGAHNMYFNTFAGTPVSSAAGLAVLTEMRNRNLQAGAVRTGELIATEMRKIAEAAPFIGSTRGQGLFFGFDIVDREDPTLPDAALTKRLVEAMKDAGVLINRIGRNDNVLKMRPPLVIEESEARTLVTRLAEVVSEIRC